MSTDINGIYHQVPKDLSHINISILAQNKYVILAKSLKWEKLAEIANKYREKKIDIKNGRPLDLRLHLGALIIQQMDALTDRFTEDMVRHHGGARILCGIESTEKSIDHKSIEKFRNQLGSDGIEELNQETVQFATIKGFTGNEICASDTTVQEAPISYPSEVAHLKNVGGKLFIIAKKIRK